MRNHGHVEHCKNWEVKDSVFCLTCFWAYPEKYEHIAGNYERIISIVFAEEEIGDYNKLIELFGKERAQEVIKEIVHEYLK